MRCVTSQEINKYKRHVAYLPSKCPPPFPYHFICLLVICFKVSSQASVLFERSHSVFFLGGGVGGGSVQGACYTWTVHIPSLFIVEFLLTESQFTTNSRKWLPTEWMRAWIPLIVECHPLSVVLERLWIVGWAEKCLGEVSFYLNIVGFLTLSTDKYLNGCGQYVISLQLKTKCLHVCIHMKCFPRTVMPRLTKIIRSGITFVSLNVISCGFL